MTYRRRQRRKKNLVDEDNDRGAKKETRHEKIVNRTLDKIFLKNIRKGVILTDGELKLFAQKKGVSLTESDLAIYRETWPDLIRYSDMRMTADPPFETILNAKYATLFLDLAFIGEPRHNSNFVGFVLACEVFTHTLGAIPFKKRTMPALEEAIEKLIRLTTLDEVVLILSDKETSLYSPQFAKKLRERYGIIIRYMPPPKKAYLAERYIRFVKTRLSACMQVANTLNWIDMLSPLINHWNSQIVEGTKFRRKDVDRNNIFDFLEQKYDIKDFHSLLNVTRIGSLKSKKWREEIFQFEEGERVLVNARLTGQRGVFYKTSVKGHFSPTVYIIKRRYLGTTKKLGLVPGK